MLILYLRKMFCFENIFVTIIVRLLNKGTEKMCRMRMWTLVYVFLGKKKSLEFIRIKRSRHIFYCGQMNSRNSEVLAVEFFLKPLKQKLYLKWPKSRYCQTY